MFRKIFYSLLSIIAITILVFGYKVEQSRSPLPPYSQDQNKYSTESIQTHYEKPSKAPNGAPWPLNASYLDKYPKLNTKGLSSVTIDNSRNKSDVFVKLVSITSSKSFPVRVFFIPSHGTFKINNIGAGKYDIRYRDLKTGHLARSESFALEETASYGGTTYSNISITIYKVMNGNMQTYGLSEDDF